jgi:hypothetical protein
LDPQDPRRRSPKPPPPGTTKNLDNTEGDINGFRPTGTSAAAALRRLERQRPDLLDQVLAGEISPHPQ